MNTDNSQGQVTEDVLVESNIPLLNHKRIVRCLSAEYKLSQKSGKPMIQFQWEIVKPTIERIGMALYQTAGLQATNWMMLDKPSLPSAKKFVAKLGLDGEFNYDQPNTEQLVGICLEVTGGAKKKTRTESNYDESGAIVETALIDPETNKAMVEYQYSFNLTTNQWSASDVIRRVSANETEMPF